MIYEIGTVGDIDKLNSNSINRVLYLCMYTMLVYQIHKKTCEIIILLIFIADTAAETKSKKNIYIKTCMHLLVYMILRSVGFFVAILKRWCLLAGLLVSHEKYSDARF